MSDDLYVQDCNCKICNERDKKIAEKERKKKSWVHIKDICPECRANVYCDTSKVLTSMPPRYNVECLECDNFRTSIPCDFVEKLEPENKKNKAKTGCAFVSLVCFMLLFMMFTFWVWVQFIKLCNYLISIGW